MATDSPNPDDSIDLPTGDRPEPASLTPDIPRDEILTHVEVPMHMPEGVRQLNAVVAHPETRRTIRHMVVIDHDDATVKERIVGLIGDREVWSETRDGLSYVGSDLIRAAPDEVLSIEEYVETIGFDQPSWRLGVGFLDKLESQNAGVPW